MERIVLLLIFLCSLIKASEPDYIFWARLVSNNLVLTSEEFHLSRAMSIDKKSTYTYTCELNAKHQNSVYESLKEQKEELIDCINKAYINEYVSVKNLKAHVKSHLRILPMYFKAEFADGKILIFTKDEV